MGISNYEKTHNAINGSRVELPCDLEVSFTKATLLKKRAFNLLFSPVTTMDSGVYRCSIVVQGETHLKTYRLNILVPPKITKAPAPTLKVVEGDGLQVSCSAEGNPTPVVSWMMKLAKGGIRIVPAHFDTDGFEYARDVLKGLGASMRRFLPLALIIPPMSSYGANYMAQKHGLYSMLIHTFFSAFVEMNGYLQISQINRQMSGTLVCQAVNGIEPKAIRKSKLDIRYKLLSNFLVTPEVNVVNSLIKQSLGGDTVLQCLVNANPIGNVVWTFGKAMIPINAPSCSVPTSKTVKYCTDFIRNLTKWFTLVELRRKNEERWSSIVSKLHILKLTEQDFGEYTCGMATMMGRHAASTKLERYVSESEYPMKLLNDRPETTSPATQTRPLAIVTLFGTVYYVHSTPEM
ncbi:unnamed protein product [Mesocestoides corti]|uniref:Ig-like domain-containing protein n=1 Tax=Mesocestoides corti TaxID=53468 RepID=A0A0R3ULK9_MESCO|nr:unnamed protein product [Mesocestoides corti]